MRLDSPTLIQFAGALHFLQVPAMILVPRVLDWRRDFSQLLPINRQLVRVVVLGIVICVLGLGLVVVSCPEQMVSTRLGRALSGFLACFWSYRSLVQLFVYSKTWPRRVRWAHFALCALFPTAALIYSGNFARSLL